WSSDWRSAQRDVDSFAVRAGMNAPRTLTQRRRGYGLVCLPVDHRHVSGDFIRYIDSKFPVIRWRRLFGLLNRRGIRTTRAKHSKACGKQEAFQIGQRAILL